MPRHEPLPPEFSGRAFSVGRALDAGIPYGQLRGGSLGRPFHGVRMLADGPSTLLARCAAYAQRMLPGQFFSHATAARLWGIPLPDAFSPDEPLHVSSFAPQRPPRTRGVIGHELRADAVETRRFGLPLSDPASCWLQLAAGGHPEAELVVAGDHLILDPVVLDPLDPRPYASIADLAARLQASRAPGKRVAAAALRRVEAGAESRPETLLRLLLLDAGLPQPELNATLVAGDGAFIARVDLLFREWRVVVEYDGDQHRVSTAQYERDMTRREALARAGWAVVYVRSRGLFVTPALTVERVRAALERAGWRR